MSGESLTLNMNADAIARLDAEAASNGYTREDFAARLVEEGLRMAKHHGIRFNPGPTGRRATLVAGPDVWEMIGAHKAISGWSEKSQKRYWKSLNLEDHQVQAAVKYYAAYRAEIDERIELNRRAGEEGYAAALEHERSLAL